MLFRSLKVTAVDARTGEFAVFDSAGDASLVDAVGASCGARTLAAGDHRGTPFHGRRHAHRRQRRPGARIRAGGHRRAGGRGRRLHGQPANELQVRKCAAIARALLETGARLGQCAGAWLLALIALWEGDAAAARAHLCALGEDEWLAIMPLNPMGVTDEVPLARIAMAVGDGELAASVVATARERLRLNPAVASIAGTAAHAEGLVIGDADHLAVAIKCFGPPRPPWGAEAQRCISGSGTRAGG